MKEFGRSMVEMLGILAIVGVISIGAIAGYQLAMNKFRANDTINELATRALLISQQLSKSNNTNISELMVETALGYPVQAFLVEGYPNLFEIEVTDVPSDVCKQILNADWKVPLQIKANDIPFTGKNISICDDNDAVVAMIFEFDKDMQTDLLGSGRCEDINDCGACEVCEDTVCVSTCNEDEQCVRDSETGNSVCCPSSRRAGPYCCASTINGKCCNTDGQCCDWWKPLVDKDGKCYDCETTENVYITKENDCNICTNREIWKDRSNTSACVLKCGTNKFHASNGTCQDCNQQESAYYFGNTTTADEQCKKVCQNREVTGYKNSACVYDLCGTGIFKDKPLTDMSGNCYTCDEPTAVNVYGITSACAVCKNRHIPTGTTQCILGCDEGYFRDPDGICQSCEDTHSFYFQGNKEMATVCVQDCPNRALNGYNDAVCSYDLCGTGIFADKPLTDMSGNCYTCNEEGDIAVNGVSHEGCNVCENRSVVAEGVCRLGCESGKFMDYNQKCQLCTDTNSYSFAYKWELAEECVNSCPNRVVNGYASCAYQACGTGIFEGKPLTSTKGECYACTDEENVNVSGVIQGGCDVCPDTRNLFGTLCVPKCTDPTKPLRGSDGNCYPCDTDIPVPVVNMTDSCKTCYSERELDGNYCILK